MRLIAIVEPISDVAKETLGELCFCHRFQCSEIEQLESCHAGKVYPVGKFTFEFFNFSFEVDLVEEQTGHLLLDLILGGLFREVLTFLVGVRPFAEFRARNLLTFRRTLLSFINIYWLQMSALIDLFVAQLLICQFWSELLAVDLLSNFRLP